MIKTIDEAVEVLNKNGWMSERWVIKQFGNGDKLVSPPDQLIGYNELEAIAIARSLNGDYEALEAENASLSSKLERVREAAKKVLRVKAEIYIGYPALEQAAAELFVALAETADENISGDNVASIGP